MFNTSVLTTGLWGSDTPYPHFTGEKTKAEKLATFPQSFTARMWARWVWNAVTSLTSFPWGVRQN